MTDLAMQIKAGGLYEQLTGPVRRLHHIQRFSSVPVLHPENVAEHSWEVAFICMVIYYDQKHIAQPTVDSGEFGCVFDGLDLEVLLERAIDHDLSEAMSGDIIRSFKYSTKPLAEAIRDADDKNMYRFSRELGHAGDAAYLGWRDAKGIHGDPNCELVAFADVVGVVIKCAEEWWLGNRQLDGICERAYNDHMLGLATKHPWLRRYANNLFPTGSHRDIYRGTPRVTDGDFKEEAQ
jgi:5'-deoxynucleotidase YfbR-like HD superfamily hydrolase